MSGAATHPVTTLVAALSGQANTITIQRPVIKMLGGDLAAALLLSEIAYWSNWARHQKDDPKGWFYKTYAEWDEAIGLSRPQIDRARTKLAEFGVEWEVRTPDGKSGSTVAHYRLDVERFVARLQESLGKDVIKATPTCRKQTSRTVGNRQVELSETDKSFYTTSTSTGTTAAAGGKAPASDEPEALAAAASLSQKPDGRKLQRRAETVAIPDGVKLIDADAEVLKKLKPEAILARFRAEHPDKWGRVEKIADRADVKFPRVVQREEVLVILDELRDERQRDAAKKPSGPKAPAPWEVDGPLPSMAARKRQQDAGSVSGPSGPAYARFPIPDHILYSPADDAPVEETPRRHNIKPEDVTARMRGQRIAV